MLDIATGSPSLSVVVPVYNEADVLPLLVARLRPVLDALGEPYEALLVDDGSTDLTPVLLERFRREWPELRVVRLRANAGHQAAIVGRARPRPRRLGRHPRRRPAGPAGD